MRSDWKRVKLGDIISIKGGFSYKGKYIGSGSTFLLGMGCVSFQEPFLHSGARLYSGDYSSSFLIFPGDIVLATRQQSDNLPILGVPAILPNDFNGKKVIVGTNLYKVNNNSIIDNQFLYWLLKSRNYRNHVLSCSTGTNVKMITKDTIESYEFLMPSKHERNAISNILWNLENLIKLNKKKIQTLEEMAQRIYKEWFVDFKYPGHENDELVDSELGMIPEGWDVGTLQDIATFSNGYAFKSKELLKNNTGTCYHIFKMGHIKKGGGFDDTKTKSFIDKSKCEKLEKYILKYGDLLMCMTDMKANVALLGHTALMNIDDEYILNQRVGLIRAKNDCSIDFPYLYILTNSRSFINDLRSRANSGVQVNLSTNEIKATKVLIPPKDINLKFDAIVRPIRDVITKYQNKNKNLRLTRDYLLPKLISGKVDVSDLDIDTSILDD